MKIVVKRSYVPIEYLAQCINNENAGHLIISWTVVGGESTVIFGCHAIDDENKINRLPS